MHTPGAHLRKSCTRPRKCARRAQGAPLISDTAGIYLYISLTYKTYGRSSSRWTMATRIHPLIICTYTYYVPTYHDMIYTSSSSLRSSEDPCPIGEMYLSRHVLKVAPTWRSGGGRPSQLPVRLNSTPTSHTAGEKDMVVMGEIECRCSIQRTWTHGQSDSLRYNCESKWSTVIYTRKSLHIYSSMVTFFKCRSNQNHNDMFKNTVEKLQWS